MKGTWGMKIERHLAPKSGCRGDGTFGDATGEWSGCPTVGLPSDPSCWDSLFCGQGWDAAPPTLVSTSKGSDLDGPRPVADGDQGEPV